MRHFLIILALLSGIAHAQEKPTNHTFRILFLERPSGAPSTLHLFDGRTSREVDLPSMNLSPVYKLPSGPLILTFLPSPPEDSEKLPEGAPAVRVPETFTDFYLLVLSDPANKVAPVRMQVVNASAETLRKGHTLWYNLSELQIGGKLGGETLIINPMGSTVMEPPRHDAGDYPVTIAYRKPDSDIQYPICQTRWEHDPRSRNLGFIIPQKGVNAPRVVVFPDFRSEPLQHASDRP